VRLWKDQFDAEEVPTLNEAIECFDKVIELNPENKAAWEIKGHLLEKLGRKGEAKKCFKKAKASDRLLTK
jgi:tetratricopeptide (TPR) repeat protein